MILSLCWPDFQTVLALGMINDKPNRWASEYLFMYTNRNIYKYTLGETKDFSTLGSSWKPEAMSVLWAHSLVCANRRRLQTCDPDIVDFLQESQALFCGVYRETCGLCFFFSTAFVCCHSFSISLAETSNLDWKWKYLHSCVLGVTRNVSLYLPLWNIDSFCHCYLNLSEIHKFWFMLLLNLH